MPMIDTIKPPQRKRETPKVSLGEALRFRPETWMRLALRAYAQKLGAATGRPLSLGAALRDLISRGLRTDPDAGYLSGFASGFAAGYSEAKKKLGARE